MGTQTISVTGMSCTGCEDTVEQALSALGGVESVTADHETNEVRIETTDGIADDVLADAVAEAGYEMV